MSSFSTRLHASHLHCYPGEQLISTTSTLQISQAHREVTAVEDDGQDRLQASQSPNLKMWREPNT